MGKMFVSLGILGVLVNGGFVVANIITGHLWCGTAVSVVAVFASVIPIMVGASHE